MTWSDFYLICFAVGFCFSFFSFILGGSRFGKLHLPHLHSHAGAHVPAAHAPVGHASGAEGHADAGAGASADSGPGHHGASVSPFNPPSLAAFLAWFGGTGYLLTRFSALWVGTALSLSIVAGLIGGAIIFLFLTKVLISDQEYLDPADFEMVGVLGKLSMPIRQGGTGELIYSQMGTRRVCGARSDDGSAIAKGTEVVVTRFEKGIAYVALWSELSGELHESGASETAK
ncbi:MAG TPA: hypothetical protein VFA67_14605 [Candidatus Sulfotelmatobacter sp.]|nr:hypothetical protein [Candidatus Sulfotelmatobacter sp.]